MTSGTDDATLLEHPRLEKGLLVLILAISLVLRLSALDVFLTTDEFTWRERSLNFHDALAQRDFKATYQAEHPGVVTMWSGALAFRIGGAVEGLGLIAETDPPLNRLDGSTVDGVSALTHWARRIIAFVTWLAILAVYFLLRYLFGPCTALIATVLIALDPFYLAHSRLHHLDGLLTTFIMLSSLSLLAYVRAGRHRGCLLLSAVAGGLAIANKSPGIFLVPWAALALGVGAWKGEPSERRQRLLGAFKAMLLWGVVAAGVVVAVWPALWVDPIGAVGKVIAGAIRQGLNPHENSNYFWFRKRADPGFGFYPVAWAFRTTPFVMVGLAALAVVRRKRSPKGPSLFLLFGFTLGYGILGTLCAKKFDRYLLPVFPLVDVLSAIGYVRLIDLARSRLSGRWKRLLPALYVTAIILVYVALLWPAHPYYLAYYNPLVGGTHTAPKILLVGWDEGLEKAAAYLNSKPDAPNLHVACGSPRQFKPFFKGHTTTVGRAPLVEPDYFVLYSSHVQRGFVPEVLEHFYGVEAPEYVVSVNGLEYAWVYPNTFYRVEAMQVLRYIEEKGDADKDIVLLNTNAALRKHYDGPLSLAVVAGPPRGDVVLNGLQWATTGRERVWFLTFPDTYVDIRALIDHHLQEQAILVDEIGIGEVRAVCYDLHEDARFVPISPAMRHEFRLGEQIRLLGYDLPRNELIPGEAFFIRFHWQANGPTGISYKVFTHLLGPDGQTYGQRDAVPQGRAKPTTIWLAGETVLDDYAIEVAQNAPPGEYSLDVGMYDLDAMERLPVYDRQGRRVAGDRILIKGLGLAATV